MKFTVAVVILAVAISVVNASHIALGAERIEALGAKSAIASLPIGGPWHTWNGALYRTRDGILTGGYIDATVPITIPTAVSQNGGTYVAEHRGIVGSGALFRDRDGTWIRGYNGVTAPIAIPTVVAQNGATYVAENRGIVSSGALLRIRDGLTGGLRDVTADIATPNAAAQNIATYVAENPGSVHVAPLIGHTQSVQSLNLDPAPGSIL